MGMGCRGAIGVEGAFSGPAAAAPSAAAAAVAVTAAAGTVVVARAVTGPMVVEVLVELAVESALAWLAHGASALVPANRCGILLRALVFLVLPFSVPLFLGCLLLLMNIH